MQVAECSRQENIAMRQIAEDSRRIAEDSKAVALATSRDSAAMRTISFVTMIFLPATFVAVSRIVFVMKTTLKKRFRLSSVPAFSIFKQSKVQP